jgi:dCMP deaminase
MVFPVLILVFLSIMIARFAVTATPTTKAEGTTCNRVDLLGCVKLKKSGVFWPAILFQQPQLPASTPMEQQVDISDVEDDDFGVEGSASSDVVVTRLLGVDDDNQLAVVKIEDRGITWDHTLPSEQVIPAMLQEKYNNAISIMESMRNAPVTFDPSQNSVLGKRMSSESPSAATLPANIMEAIRDPGPAGSMCHLADLKKMLKRDNAILWDDYFMAVAFLSAMRSKDPSTQVGACIVNADKRIVGIGYNGFPRGCSDDELPWARSADNEMDTKYPYVCHAEVNAILNKNSAEVRGCALFVALFPCNDCAKIIIQSGITEVVYLSDKYKDTVSMMASRRMLDMAKVKLRQYHPSKSSVTIDFSSISSIVK